jgi:hypothetical protein
MGYISGEKKRSTQALIGIGSIISLIIISILAYMIGWSSGAEKILTATLVLIGMIPIKNFF